MTTVNINIARTYPGDICSTESDDKGFMVVTLTRYHDDLGSIETTLYRGTWEGFNKQHIIDALKFAGITVGQSWSYLPRKV